MKNFLYLLTGAQISMVLLKAFKVLNIGWCMVFLPLWVLLILLGMGVVCGMMLMVHQMNKDMEDD